MAEELHRVVYASAAAKPFTAEELDALLAQSRHSNAGWGVTGLMLYHDGSILQVLEGPPGPTLALYDVIRTDPRHRRIITLWSGRAEERAFGNWRMGFVEIERLAPDLRRDAVALEAVARHPPVDDPIVARLVASFLRSFRDLEWLISDSVGGASGMGETPTSQFGAARAGH